MILALFFEYFICIREVSITVGYNLFLNFREFLHETGFLRGMLAESQNREIKCVDLRAGGQMELDIFDLRTRNNFDLST